MFERLSEVTLRWARVTPRPDPPIGAPGSARTFRAGRNYYYIRLLRWGAAQIGALIGILFSIGFVLQMERGFERARAEEPAPGVAGSSSGRADSRPVAPEPGRALAVALIGDWFLPFVVFLEFLGIGAFLIQIPFTYALARLEYEQHWYIVTDRSLRIRTGVLSLSESTMSFANLQQVEVKQGPLQRLLGLADVRVRSAGGGGNEMEGHGPDALHTGIFRSVENAEEIRDLIVNRLRAFREAGLGDPDSAGGPSEPGTDTIGREALLAAREVLEEARVLRAAVLAQS